MKYHWRGQFLPKDAQQRQRIASQRLVPRECSCNKQVLHASNKPQILIGLKMRISSWKPQLNGEEGPKYAILTLSRFDLRHLFIQHVRLVLEFICDFI